MSAGNLGKVFGTMAVVGIATATILYYFGKDSSTKIVDDTVSKEKAADTHAGSDKSSSVLVKIVFATVTGTAKTFAYELAELLRRRTTLEVSLIDVKDYDPDLLEKEQAKFIYIGCTWEGGVPPESAKVFYDWVQDFAFDYRVGNNALANLEFAAFGLGSSVYGPHYCKSVLDINDWLVKLGAVPLMEPVIADDQTNLQDSFRDWERALCVALTVATGTKLGPHVPKSKGKGFTRKGGDTRVQKKLTSAASSAAGATASASGASGSGSGSSSIGSAFHKQQVEASLLDDEEEEEDKINSKFIYISDSDTSDEEAKKEKGGAKTGTKRVSGKGKIAAAGGVDTDAGDGLEGIVDVEDIGKMVHESRKVAAEPAGREMVTKLQRKALTKEGYRIIGSHSAVKLCRWTKNQLRGRGGCYKHTFYGITSYQCMEATPSLACANKCVFCWRHHKNPVGTEWRWKTDDPFTIVDEAVKLHQGMINEMRGVPGVQADRLEEAFTVMHCALSLVGEPIMYPRINELLGELHARDISTFMVTNAQFPEQIAALSPVTQMYVSVDASTKETLKAIDRPLFKDFWERFQGSLEALATRQQRTVYRLTLVNEWNMKEADEYANLIERHQPDFIEIKAVTYCGKSDGSSLTMQNVPRHAEVCAYSEAILKTLMAGGKSVPYSIATEHEHSCCVLIAREDKFKPNGEWHTWIDYTKYHILIKEYNASGGTKTFRSEDYMAKTPTWALYQSVEKGFDPVENRWRRNKKGEIVERDYKSSDSGCG